MKLCFSVLAFVVLISGCRPRPSESDEVPVNQPRPNPVVEPTNQAGVPLTNVPVERSRTNR
jgi:hypothetical protein